MLGYILIVLLILLALPLIFIYPAFSISPQFIRQQIVVAPDDWRLQPENQSNVTNHEGNTILTPGSNNIAECKVSNKFVSPSISSVSYSSDGNIFNATIWLNKMFKEPSLNDTLESETQHVLYHEITFTMVIALDSVQHAGIADYRQVLYRPQSNNWTWTKVTEEVSAAGQARILESPIKNYTAFYDKNQAYYILFSFDLSKINFPQQYRALFYITDSFVKDDHHCTLIDTTNWVSVPPPEFTLSSMPTSVTLRQGESTDINLLVKGNTHIASEASLFLLKGKIDMFNHLHHIFSPNRTSIPSLGSGVSSLHLAVSDDAMPKTYILPISANISFPTIIDTHKGGLILNNSKIQSILQTSNLTLTVLPKYTPSEWFINGVNYWMAPISSLWSFLLGVGTAVVAPLILVIRRRNRMKNQSPSNPSSTT